MTAILVAERLVAGYGPIEVLHGISLTLGEGSIAAILGPNGAGKTTLLRAISGTIGCRGRVSFGGVPVAGKPPHRVAALGIAHVPQGGGVFAGLTVAENLRSGSLLRRDRSRVSADCRRVLLLFPRLAARLSQAAGLLSGGEQQMLAIGRALMGRPRLLMLDEPSLGLAPGLAAEVFAVLGTLRRDEGLSILLIEQNAALAFSIAGEVHLLESGAIRISGSPKTMQAHPDFAAIYLGGSAMLRAGVPEGSVRDGVHPPLLNATERQSIDRWSGGQTMFD